MPLIEKGWSSLHSVVNENEFWSIIEKLKEYGAQEYWLSLLKK